MVEARGYVMSNDYCIYRRGLLRCRPTPKGNARSLYMKDGNRYRFLRFFYYKCQRGEYVGAIEKYVMRYLLTLSLLVLALTANARQITFKEAQTAAQEFFNKPAEAQSRASRAPSSVRVISATQSGGNAPYYIFNASDNNGFVIISGDDRANKILGYSDSGNFDVTNMPPQLSALLERYSENLSSLITSDINPTWSAPAYRSKSNNENGVLLKTANWGQDAPYNLDCPENCVTGCVATAMAIVMKYHGWPKRGRGSNYNPSDPDRGEYSFDTDYDWDNALMDYSNYYENPESYTESQIKAVSKIMHDCATSIESNFLSGGMTSADDHDCAFALRNFFFYDGNIGHTYIKTIDRVGDNALSFIKSEIDAGRPMIIGGEAVVGYVGHAWVIDGYDSNDMVHVNWGWSGAGNGYYDYPISMGYSSDKITYNIKPTDKWVEYSPWELPAEGSLNIDVVDVKQNEYFNAYCYLIDAPNIFHHPQPDPICTGTLAIALTDANGSIKQVLRELSINEWYADRLKGGSQFTGLQVTVPIAETDSITLIAKPTGYQDWMKFGNPPFAFTSRPVRGNTPKIANVNIRFVGDEFNYTCQSVGTSGKYLQTKPMASGSFTVNFQYPAGKERIWLATSDLPIGTIYQQSHVAPPMVPISLPYEHGDMNVDVYAMAYNESDLIQDWTTVNVAIPGTLKSELNGEKRIRTQKLRITGVMNSEDFTFIRNEMPFVKHLDIGDVRIIADFYNVNDDYIPDGALSRKRLDSIILPSSLKGIGLSGLSENSFSKLELPATLEYLGLGAFWEGGDLDLMDIYCHNPVPPTIQGGQSGNEENMFQKSTYSRATLWLPKGSKDDYLNQPYVWHNFVNVREFMPDGIDGVSADSDTENVEIYNLQGIKVYAGKTGQGYNLPSGIYVYKKGDVCKRISIKN